MRRDAKRLARRPITALPLAHFEPALHGERLARLQGEHLVAEVCIEHREVEERVAEELESLVVRPAFVARRRVRQGAVEQVEVGELVA